MDTQTLILTITGAALVPFLGWVGAMLLSIKQQQAVMLEKIGHLSNNHDGLSTWVGQIATDVNKLQHAVTVLETKGEK